MSPGLVTLWNDGGRRLAVLAGAGVALVALAAGCPLGVATLRGGATLVGTVVLVQLAARVLAWSAAGDREEALARAAQPVRVESGTRATTAAHAGTNGSARANGDARASATAAPKERRP